MYLHSRPLAKSEWPVACVLPRVCVFAVLALGDIINKQLRQRSVVQKLDDQRILNLHLNASSRSLPPPGQLAAGGSWQRVRTAGRLCGCSAMVTAECGKAVVSRVIFISRQVARFSWCSHRPTKQAISTVRHARLR